MTYKLVYTKTAFKDIQKLDKVTQKRIKVKLEAFAIAPKISSKKLTNSSVGQYRFRIGNYRVVFDIDRNNIVILRMGHRKEIYKK